MELELSHDRPLHGRPQTSSVLLQVRFLEVELTHQGSNPRFDMVVVFIANYCFRRRRHPRR
jgi:hypothetical protein